jgi:hypothetical protein
LRAKPACDKGDFAYFSWETIGFPRVDPSLRRRAAETPFDVEVFMKKIALSAVGALAAGAALFAAPQAAQAQFLSVGFGGSNYYGYGSGISVGFGSSYGYPYSGYGYGYSPVTYGYAGSYYDDFDGYYARPVVTRRVVYRAPRTVVRRVVYGSPRTVVRTRVVSRPFYGQRRVTRVVYR